MLLSENCTEFGYKILIIKPTRYTNFSNLFLEQNSICFGQFICPTSGVFHVPSWFCSLAVWHIPLLYLQWKTPDDGQRNCPKHVEFYSKNKFEKLVHLVGFVIRMYHETRSSERQICYKTEWICINDSDFKLRDFLILNDNPDDNEVHTVKQSPWVR